MAARVTIDPNVRVRGNQTYAGLEDVHGTIAVGSHVEVYEAETGLIGPAEVTDIDHQRQLVYLAVDWEQLHAQPASGYPLGVLAEAARRLQAAIEAILRHLAVSARQRAR
jgi:hypothetical protein